MLKKLVASLATISKCSTTCCVFMLLDDLSKQWMFSCAQADSCYKQCMLIDHKWGALEQPARMEHKWCALEPLARVERKW